MEHVTVKRLQHTSSTRQLLRHSLGHKVGPRARSDSEAFPGNPVDESLVWCKAS